MKVYITENVRNLALVGRSGSGKVDLTEAMLFQSGAIQKIGHVDERNTMPDFSKEERERGPSIGTSIIPIEWWGRKPNIIDTPGTIDFIGGTQGVLRASKAVLMIIDTTAGVQVGSEGMWKYAEKIGLSRITFVNKIDGENVSFRTLMEELEDEFGKKIIPFSVPIGEGEDFVGVTDAIFQKGHKYTKGVPEDALLNHDQVKAAERMYEEIAEVVAEANEALMEKYFPGKKFTRGGLLRGITEVLIVGDVVSLSVGPAEKGIGIDVLLNTIIDYMPVLNHDQTHIGFRYESGEERKVSPDGPYSAVVFRTVTNPSAGKISTLKVCFLCTSPSP